MSRIKSNKKLSLNLLKIRLKIGQKKFWNAIIINILDHLSYRYIFY